ncbi:MAG: hypothetical protein AAF355_14060 [Myxococcota bacterium]
MKWLKMLERIAAAHRRTFARFAAVCGAVIVSWTLYSELPREIEILYNYGLHRFDVTRVSIDYLKQGESVHGVSFEYPRGTAPAKERHRLTLARGHYRVLARLSLDGRSKEFARAVEIPQSDVYQIDLFEIAVAAASGERSEPPYAEELRNVWTHHNSLHAPQWLLANLIQDAFGHSKFRARRADVDRRRFYTE